jgi:hypothetical protein
VLQGTSYEKTPEKAYVSEVESEKGTNDKKTRNVVKKMTKDHEGNIKTITLRENEALIFVEIYDDSDWLYFQKQIKEEENKKK